MKYETKSKYLWNIIFGSCLQAPVLSFAPFYKKEGKREGRRERKNVRM